MGVCCSSGSKSESSLHHDGKGMNKASRKISSATVHSEGGILKSPNLEKFCFSELKAATVNFSLGNLLGQGGFGLVFQGWIDKYSLTASSPEMGMAIAVKMLRKKGSQGQQEWLKEIKYLGQLHHPNLVNLIGYCIEDDKRLLVYEFMPNGSLENHIIKTDSFFQPLSWNLRMKIALGAAKGLAFLHDDAQVIYRDFKTSNVLLDTDYNAKLSDFGFAKDGPTDDRSHLTASILGTHGYLAPEYANKGRLTTKVDVYSFGVVLLEMISGRSAIDDNRLSEDQNLVEWAKLHLSRKGKIFLVLDDTIEGENALRGALKAAELAGQCLSTEPRLRPTMKEVVEALEQLYNSS
ncbi:probable serine/threonine-protein kinase PBL9 isoform X2 [Manihot esculenta]|uniref:Uncharacterized protein n=1 Tax=Manihot esculenta TaxID=3983 RepID=A0ACB7HH50_MANES|nr:probable serine/threonine-protein kinase PBL9 isoform X2 [Manihot esculenta]KAG8651284.1 hypothetical protein MANES_07G108700v8 [Manihot esculenta]